MLLHAVIGAVGAWWSLSTESGVEHDSDDSTEPRQLLMSTEWHWNSWRNVKFHAPRRDQQFAKFWAPTEDCESGGCSWSANATGIFVMWGEAGLHRMELRGRTTLEGRRVLDGEPFKARLIGHFVEELFDLDL